MENVRLSEDGTKVVILDQTQLPGTEVYLDLENAEDMYEAIRRLQVRGAPAIGIFAGYAIYCLARKHSDCDYQTFYRKFMEYKEYLNSSRPTAVNLSWALKRMQKVVEEQKNRPVEEIVCFLKEESMAIQEEDIQMCRAISEYGLRLVKDGDGILTHCNAGPLATSRYGTSGVAILANYYGIPFYVLGPTSTIDLSCRTGEEIQIELRDPEEIKKMFYERPMAPEEVRCYNLSFDVTDHSLIAGIVTEYGICRAPYEKSLKDVMEKRAKGERCV